MSRPEKTLHVETWSKYPVLFNGSSIDFVLRGIRILEYLRRNWFVVNLIHLDLFFNSIFFALEMPLKLLKKEK